MTDTQLLVGSLSSDLFRVATLTQRGSVVAAQRFLDEAKRWAEPLTHKPLKEYILNIAKDVSSAVSNQITLEQAEKYLMYGILLQNYALHSK
jgi:hypothetical protein